MILLVLVTNNCDFEKCTIALVGIMVVGLFIAKEAFL